MALFLMKRFVQSAKENALRYLFLIQWIKMKELGCMSFNGTSFELGFLVDVTRQLFLFVENILIVLEEEI